MTPERFYGMKLVERPYPRKSVQVRSHRKRRVNKKWAKRFGFRLIVDTTPFDADKILCIGETYYCYPHVAQELKKRLASL